MKIVYCIAGLFNSGGMERVLSLKANYLVSKGFDVTIITTDQNERSPFFHLDNRINILDLGINYNPAPSSFLSKTYQYILKQAKHKRILRTVLDSLKADIVVSMFDHEVSVLPKIADGSKKVLEIHFSRFKRIQYNRKGIYYLIDYIRSWYDLKLAKKYDKFVVLTEEDKLNWGNLPNLLNIPNPNSFDTNSFSNLTNKKVIAVGRLDYQKSFEDLILAWSRLDAKFNDWTLNIYGDGPQKEKLIKLVNTINLQDRVFLNRAVKELKGKYIESSILAMTSKYEGLPMALLEGQACGLPLISYACKCGPKDIIQDGINGFLIAEGDQKAFTNALEKLMEDIELRMYMGENSIRLSKRFSLENVMDQWIKLFIELKS